MVARTMENRLANTVGARPGSAEDGRENDLLDEIDAESFPASDPPPWPATHLGSPCRESDSIPLENGKSGQKCRAGEFAMTTDVGKGDTASSAQPSRVAAPLKPGR